MDNLKQKTMYKLFLFLSFFFFIGSINAQTAPIKKKAYVDEQKILNVEAATPRAGYISAPYRKTDGNWYEKTDAGVEQLIIDTVAMLATKYDLQNVSVDTINEIATKYELRQKILFASDFGFSVDNTHEENHISLQNAINYAVALYTSDSIETVINIKAGVYNVGSLLLDAVDQEIWNIEQVKGLTIKGLGEGKTIFSGSRNYTGDATSSDFFRIRNAPNTTFENLEFRSIKRPIDMDFNDAENSADSNMIKAIYVVAFSPSGNNLSSHNILIKNCGFRYLYGIAIHINDYVENPIIDNCVFKDLYRDVNGGTPQPTGVLINNSFNVELKNSTFENIIDLNGGLSHSVYLGNNKGGKMFNNVLNITHPQFNASNNGSGGLQFLSGDNIDFDVYNNTFTNVKNNISDLTRSKIRSNLFVNVQNSIYDISNIQFYQNTYNQTKELGSFKGINNILGTTYDVFYTNERFVYPDTFASTSANGNSFMFESGNHKRIYIKYNDFVNVNRAITLGRNSGSVDSSFIQYNTSTLKSSGKEMVYLLRGKNNVISNNTNIFSSNSDVSASIVRDNDGTISNTTPNKIYENRNLGNILNDPYSNLAHNTIESVNFQKYGLGDYTGIETYSLSVDSNGDVIEVPPTSGTVEGTGVENYITKWSTGGLNIENSSIFDNGNVGIGTTTPGEKLQIHGKVIFKTTSSSSRYIYFGDLSAQTTSNQGLNIYTKNTGDSKIQSYNTAARMDFTIGNFDQTRLTMYGRSHPTKPNGVEFITSTPSSDTPIGDIVFTASDANSSNTVNVDGANVEFNAGAGVLGIGNYGNIILNKNGGNLGIGTTTPDAKLDVEGGNVRFSEYGSGTVTGTAAKYLAVESDGDVIEVDAPTGGSVDTLNEIATKYDLLYSFSEISNITGDTTFFIRCEVKNPTNCDTIGFDAPVDFLTVNDTIDSGISNIPDTLLLGDENGVIFRVPFMDEVSAGGGGGGTNFDISDGITTENITDGETITFQNGFSIDATNTVQLGGDFNTSGAHTFTSNRHQNTGLFHYQFDNGTTTASYPTAKMLGNGDFILGAGSAAESALGETGAHLYFDKSQGAIIGGWNNSSTNITTAGDYSFNWSRNSIASGAGAFVAGGLGNSSTGTFSFSIGQSNTSSSTNSFAGGINSTASNTRAFVFGNASTSSGIMSYTVGDFNNNSGQNGSIIGANNSIDAGSTYSIIQGDGNSMLTSTRTSLIGRDNSATDSPNSVLMGYGNTATTSEQQILIGRLNAADAEGNVLLGYGLSGNSYRSTVTGKYNIDFTATKTSNVSTDELFSIGKGTTTSKSNVVTILKNGSILFNASQGGASGDSEAFSKPKTTFEFNVVNEAGTAAEGGVLLAKMTAAQKATIPAGNLVDGMEIYCSDCTANDSTIGVKQVYQISTTTWKNLW
jgi:hypothetical protein